MEVLTWSKNPDGSYRATMGRHDYTIILEPRPVDRYVAYVDGTVQRARDGDLAGQRLLFWYLQDAKQHCQDLAVGGTGFLKNTEKQTRAIDNASHAVVPFPTKNQVIAAVRAVTSADGRTWPIVDRAWGVLSVPDATPSAHTIKTLKLYVMEIAKWGGIRRWLQEEDLSRAALALWDVRNMAAGLRGRDYSEVGVADQVILLYNGLLERMRKRGVTKTHYSWATKILHWLLPASAPVYDSLVLRELQIQVTGLEAYRQIVAWEYGCAAKLEAVADEVIGGIREMTLLAAIDNFLWWSGKSR